MIRRWLWLLIIGAIVGTGAAYLLGRSQDPVYQASTKVMVIQPREGNVSADLTPFSDQELMQTYMALLVTEPVLQATSDALGFPLSANQISARQLAGTRLLEVTVRANTPEQAAQIANSLVEILIEYNESLQTGRFAIAEESLQTQIDQVETQIQEVQSELQQLSQVDVVSELAQVEAQIADTQANIIDLQFEIDALSSLPEEDRVLLQDKRLELAALKLTLGFEQMSYNSRLLEDPTNRAPETEDQLLALQEDIVFLEQEIETLSANTGATNPEEERLLLQKQLEIERLQNTLIGLEASYLALLNGNVGGDNQDIQQQNRQETLTLYRQIYSNLITAYESTRLARLQGTPNVVQVEAASTPAEPIAPQIQQAMIRGAIIGLLFAAGIAYLIEYLDDTVKTPGDVEQVVNLPTLAGIMRIKPSQNEGERRLVTMEQPRAPVSEAFRILRTGILFSSVDRESHVLLITSPNPMDGKSVVAANLAVVMAQAGHRVLLVDADLRRPVQHKIFEQANGNGLTNMLLNMRLNGSREAQHEQLEQVIRPTSQTGLELLSSGPVPPNPSELLGSEKMKALISLLKESYDFIIFDSPPGLAVTDALILASLSDSTLLMTNVGQTRLNHLVQIVNRLREVNAHIIGVVLNRLTPRGDAYYYYYHYQNSYYSNGTNGQGPRKEREKENHLNQPL
jgi:capsular exopolysaccharide synthesis family protein